MANISMYYHGGSGNHGCEAIVRGTCKILGGKTTLYTSASEEDLRYGLDQVTEIREDKECRLRHPSLKSYYAAVMHKLRKDDFHYVRMSHQDFFRGVNAGDVYLSIGGDNYCYKGRDVLGYYNKAIHDRGAKTVLWGCSVDPADLTPEVKKDLARYDLIVAREEITYSALKKINENCVLLPDPAFQLDKEELPLPNGFKEGHTIGINVSPLAGEYGGEAVFDNYKALVRWLIAETEEQILLVPHVVKPGNDDRTVLKAIYHEFAETGRVIMLEDCNCLQLKGYIARCRLFIGARTHATIAAYSTSVPTLVAGYSVKATGIARELFGTDENYVVPVQHLKSEWDLIQAFEWLFENESTIRNHLETTMPDYRNKVLVARQMVEAL